jgi:FtsX-like permease family protein
MRRAWSELPLTRAQWDKLLAMPSGAYISRTNAERLQVKEGDPLPIVPQNSAEADGRRSIELTVLGVMDDDPQWDYHQILIGNAIAESVDERIGELAVLVSLGFSQNLVRALVFAEALLPCLAGALLGGVLASRLSALPRALAPQSLAALPPEKVLGDILVNAIVFAILLAAVASVAPLHKLTRLKVAAALAGRRGK